MDILAVIVATDFAIVMAAVITVNLLSRGSR